MAAAAVVAQASTLLSLLDQASSSSSDSTSSSSFALHRAAAVQNEVLQTIHTTGLLSSLASVAATPADVTRKGQGAGASDKILPGQQATSGSGSNNRSATATSLLHKLCKRASSLLSGSTAPISSPRAPPALVLSRSLGFSLALALVQQVGWPVLSYESTATTYITAGFQVLQSYAAVAPASGAQSAPVRICNEEEEQVLRNAILLVGEEILRTGSSGGKGLVQGGDFLRTIITPNVPKYANLLVGALQGAIAHGDLRAQVSLNI